MHNTNNVTQEKKKLLRSFKRLIILEGYESRKKGLRYIVLWAFKVSHLIFKPTCY